MPRLMAVSLTEDQVRSRAKTVTRRAGWRMLTPGTRLTLCRKVMGRRHGEPLDRITDVEVTSVRRERLDAITAADVTAEGFPGMTPAEFIAFFCRTHHGITPDSEITRIEWQYIAAAPPVVCLCSSTRFYDEFQQANYDLTMRGEIVLTVGFYPHAQARHGHGEGVAHDSAEKTALDELHKRKIDLADYVLVLNVGGYIGDSTRSEITYAEACGKPVRYLESPGRAA